MIKKKVGVVLPYNTPHEHMFDELSSKLFHPATLLHGYKSTPPFKLPYCFTGFGSIQVGVSLGFDVTVMIGNNGFPAETFLKACINFFIDPANPFANVSTQETPNTSIAGQVADFFADNEEYESALVIWPYQTFENEKALFHSDSNSYNADFVFSHPLMKVDKYRIPECIVVAPRDMMADKEMECANALSVGTVDDILRGSFTRALSMVEIDREPFEEFRKKSFTPDDISVFLGSYLRGKRGILIDPRTHQFIT